MEKLYTVSQNKTRSWPWCWEWLKVGREGDNRRWDGWIAPPTQWTWVWVNPGSWWWTERPGMLQSMGSQRVRRDWVTELNWTLNIYLVIWLNQILVATCRIISCSTWDLLPWLGIEFRSSTLEVWRLGNWLTKKVPSANLKKENPCSHKRPDTGTSLRSSLTQRPLTLLLTNIAQTHSPL